jgi:hypothetical protein
MVRTEAADLTEISLRVYIIFSSSSVLIIIDLAPGRVLPIIPPATIGLGVSQSPSAAAVSPTQRLPALPFPLEFPCAPPVLGAKYLGRAQKLPNECSSNLSCSAASSYEKPPTRARTHTAQPGQRS